MGISGQTGWRAEGKQMKESLWPLLLVPPPRQVKKKKVFFCLFFFFDPAFVGFLPDSFFKMGVLFLGPWSGPGEILKSTQSCLGGMSPGGVVGFQGYQEKA